MCPMQLNITIVITIVAVYISCFIAFRFNQIILINEFRKYIMANILLGHDRHILHSDALKQFHATFKHRRKLREDMGLSLIHI